MLDFKIWFENSNIEINEPYYRIVSPMHGSGAERNKMDSIGPGTYWTPRWDAVLFMLRSIFLHAKSARLNWNVKVFETNKAIMQSAPTEHKWAFKYAHDAGEMILVKLLDTPKIIFNHSTNDTEFENIVDQSFQHKEPINYENNGIKANWNGDLVILSPNYKEKVLDIVKKQGWQFQVLKKIKNKFEFEQMQKQMQIDWKSDPHDALIWFLHDMGW